MDIFEPILAGRGVLGPGKFLLDFGACGGGGGGGACRGLEGGRQLVMPTHARRRAFSFLVVFIEIHKTRHTLLFTTGTGSPRAVLNCSITLPPRCGPMARHCWVSGGLAAS